MTTLEVFRTQDEMNQPKFEHWSDNYALRMKHQQSLSCRLEPEATQVKTDQCTLYHSPVFLYASGKAQSRRQPWRACTVAARSCSWGSRPPWPEQVGWGRRCWGSPREHHCSLSIVGRCFDVREGLWLFPCTYLDHQTEWTRHLEVCPVLRTSNSGGSAKRRVPFA